MTYKAVRDALMSQRPASDEVMTCSFCGQPTTRGTLAMFGARCGPCYRAYCQQGLPKAKETQQ